MLEMPIGRVVEGLVRHLLIDAGGKDGEGLFFRFDVSMAHYSDRGSYSSRKRCLDLLYYLPKGYTYVSVFSRSAGFKSSEIEAAPWNHEVTHDSCWRDLRIFPDTYFALAREVNAERVEDGLPEVAPRDMSEHNDFRLFGAPFSWVPVEVKKDPTDPNSYRKILTLK